MLKCEEIRFIYEGKPLLDGVTFAVERGEVVTLLGASGAGKTTLFQLLVGLLLPDGGKVEVKGSIAYMMQESQLLGWRTVLENVLLVSELGQREEKREGEALELLEWVGLKDFVAYPPSKLSMGMRQRVSLARALYRKAPILLLDEPFASLDVAIKEELYHLLSEVNRKFGTTILLITHDFHDALTLSKRILLLKEGKIQKEWQVPEIQDLIAVDSIKKEMRSALKN